MPVRMGCLCVHKRTTVSMAVGGLTVTQHVLAVVQRLSHCDICYLCSATSAQRDV
jgi:hypothetical protein